MAAEHQTNVLRRIDQFLPNGLRPVSGRKFVALAFFATAVRIEKRMGQDDYPVVAVFFRLDQTARPVERLVAGREFESDHQQIAPRRIMEFIGGILQRMNIFVIEADSGQMRDDLGIAFGIDVLRHHRKAIFRRNVAHVVIPLTNDIGNPAVQPFQGP